MAVRFAVFIAVSLDGFIARADGALDWLDPFHGEDHGYGAFFAGVDALVIGRGTYDTVVGFPEWPYGEKRVIVCTSRAAEPRHGEELWSGPPRALAERLEQRGFLRGADRLEAARYLAPMAGYLATIWPFAGAMIGGDMRVVEATVRL